MPPPQARERGRSRFADAIQLEKSGAARRDKTLAAPCRYSEILAGKCGFAGQPERRFDGSGMSENGNAIRVLT